MHRVVFAGLIGGFCMTIGGCAVEVVGTGIAGDRQGTIRASNVEAVIDESAYCEADLRIDPAALRQRPGGLLGRTECEVVALKGRPQGVDIRYQERLRLTTLQYRGSENADYRFRDNRLISVDQARF